MTVGLCMIFVTDSTSAKGKSRNFVKTQFCVLLSGTEDCSSKNVTGEPATSSYDDLSVNSASGNRTSSGGRVTRAVSDGPRGDLSTVTRSWFGMWLGCESSGCFALLYCDSILSLSSSSECKEHCRGTDPTALLQ